MSVALWSCRKTPDGIIPPDEMASLLADVHKGEGIVELNQSKFATDSMKMLMRQSVFARHGVTADMWDTSLVWYGHHLEQYIEVYDKVIEQLESELKTADVASQGAGTQMEVVGDSVDAWPLSRLYRFAANQPSDIVKFALRRDDNWEPGDIYTLRFRLTNHLSPLMWRLAADYNDGTTDYTYGTTGSDGWTEVAFAVDTAKTANHIRGTLMMTPVTGEAAYVDSISLVRTRFKEGGIYPRNFIHTYLNGKKEAAK